MASARKPLTERIHDLAQRAKTAQYATTLDRDVVCELAEFLDELALQCEVTAQLQARTNEQLQSHLDGKDWR